MKEEVIKKQRRIKRTKRVRAKILAVSRLQKRPRLSVFRSNKHLYAQIIDDRKGMTLVSVHEKEVTEASENKIKKAELLGVLLAGKAKKNKINKVIFDKGSYKYHGIVKAFAEGARKGGIEF